MGVQISDGPLRLWTAIPPAFVQTIDLFEAAAITRFPTGYLSESERGFAERGFVAC